MTVDMKMLEKAHKFHYALRAALIGETEQAVPPGARTNAAFSYCKIALEHGAGFQSLLADDNPTAALALVRLQYEAVLRGTWVFFAASEEWIDKFSSQPKSNHGNEPVEFPKVYKMLEHLAASSVDPILHQSLSGLKNKAWDSLNSYTHGGLRLMIRSLEGFEEELLIWMLRTTNSLSYIAAQLLAYVAQDAKCGEVLHQTRMKMADCLHPLPSTQQSD